MFTFLSRITKHPYMVLGVALFAGLLGCFASSRLKLKTAFSELLPNDDPGVITLQKTQERMGDLSLLLIGIRSPDVAANERYAEALVTHLRTLPPTICEIATYHVRDFYEFVRAHRWLYASQEDLTEIRDRLRREIARRKNPLFVDMGLDEDDAAFEQRLKQPSRLEQRFPNGLFRHPQGDTLWVVALPQGGLLAENPGEALIRAAEKFVREHPPAEFHPAMDVQTAGPMVTPTRAKDALARDLLWVGGICLILIPLSIGIYFGRIRALFFVGVPAVLATILAYATAFVAFGSLNTVTSFLVSFVMGNGTNYAIVLLAHYEQLRAKGEPAHTASAEAVRDVWRTTGVAALASAISYLSLLVTSFRGFSQFGLIGAAGSLFAWVATFTVLPALLNVFDRRAIHRRRREGHWKPLGRLATAIEASPGRVLVAAGVVTVLAVAGAARFRTGVFEYDFRKLTAQGLMNDRLRSFDRDKDTLFGRWPQPTVVLTDRVEDVQSVREAIRTADDKAPGGEVIGQIITVDDLLPGPAEVQRLKLTLLDEIRSILDDPALVALDEEEQRRLAELRPPIGLKTLVPADLPPLARRPFTETNGIVGRVLLLYPAEQGLSIWDGRDLLRIASVVQTVNLPDGRQLETSGSAVIFASMLRSIVRDGPLATITSLCAVVLLVLFRVRPLRSALLVIGALLLGVSWMVGIAGWVGMRITFLNFIALPFIFGVGVEYAIHVVAEQRQHGSVVHTVLSAGGPVALCSWSAIVGYGSLLFAQNGALQGLGAIATAGEVMCLLAAVLVLPALFVWLARRRRSVAEA